KASATAPRIKVFRLVHRNAEEVRAILEQFLPGGAPNSPMSGGSGGMMGLMGPGGGGPRPPSGGGPGMPTPGGPSGPPGMSGGSMGMGPGPGMMGAGAPSRWRLAVDVTTNSLIVRGSEQDIKRAADLIAVLDLGEGQTAPQVKTLRTFRLRFASAENVATV